MEIPASLDQLRKDTETLLYSGTLSNDGKNMLCATMGMQLHEFTKARMARGQVAEILISKIAPALKVAEIVALVK